MRSVVFIVIGIVSFVYGLKKFIYLENNTKEQKKIIKRMFLIEAILTLVFALVGTVCADKVGKSSIISIIYVIAGVMMIVSLMIGLIALIYSSVTARNKAKWMGVFVFIPMFGYITMTDALIDIPFRLMALDADSMYYQLYSKLYNMFSYILMSALVFWIFYSKKRPAFIKKIESDIENRSLSFWEEAAIWLIGCWMLAYNIILSVMAEQIPTWIANIWLLSNLVLGVVITAFVVGNSYRRYYYEKNIKYQKTLITTMANLVESRDDNTGGHIHRTAKYVEIIARRLKKEGKFKEILTDEYISDMVVAAPLHDVGKIHISDVVLNKPGKLTDDEFAQMKSHSAAGGEIINQVEEEVGEDISYLSIAKDMAEYHHERMDGKGYPHGIKGDEIPVCARILAVADVFDALISKRCYKAAMPLDKAFAIIKEETGDHFDADVAQAFLDSREEVEQYLNDISEKSKVGNTAESN